MRKLVEVEEAKALMTEAMGWSVMKWLTEKKRVRQASDKANQALWAMQKQLRTQWSEDLKAAYKVLEHEKDHHADGKNTEIYIMAKGVKEADDEAYRAHMDAENTFSKAEKRLSTSMAREGCRKAIESWELYEKAIHKAEAGVRTKAAI